MDLAILADAPLRIRHLLESGANPNVRWWSHGDRLPIQEAIEFPSYETRQQYRSEIIRLLLQHGADPNARWCPFESRSRDLEKFGIPGCTSDGGGTPLIAAAIRKQPDTIHLLLDAGADPALEDVSGGTALDYVHEDATLLLLQARMFPERSSRNNETLRYLRARADSADARVPWEQTPLARAAAGVFGGAGASIVVPPPPPPPPGAATSGPSIPSERVRVLLGIGADPNERVSWGNVDWTPLSIAVHYGDARLVQVLLDHGADPNHRWCVQIDADAKRRTRDVACTLMDGMTPLMLAASAGRSDIADILARSGADGSLRDWQGRTATDYRTAARTRNNERGTAH